MADGSLAREHTPEAVAARLAAGHRRSHLRDFIYGAIDGAVTTFAVVCGVEGAGLPPVVIVVLGLANLIGDGFSMAAGNFLGTRAEQQLLARARRREEQHIEAIPEGEREEIRQIFAAKGFAGDDLERAVGIITADRKRWVETMLRDELDLPTAPTSPLQAGATTFVAFILVGMVPLLPFVVGGSASGGSSAFVASIVLTGLAFFAVGAAKSRFVDQRWHAAGLETVFVGGLAAVLAFAVGRALRGLVG